MDVFNQRLISYAVIFGVDFYDHYCHTYPSPKKNETIPVNAVGPYKKYECLFGRLCWMIISYTAWYILLSKSYVQWSVNNTELFFYESICILGIIFGFIIRIISKHSLNKYYTYDITIYQNHTIVSHGLYGYIRHPGYLGMLLKHSCVYCLVNNWYGWIVMLHVWREAIIQIELEEKILSNKLKDKHESYQERVPFKLLPFLW